MDYGARNQISWVSPQATIQSVPEPRSTNTASCNYELSRCYVAGFRETEGASHTGGRGGITQGVSFEFFESFLLIYSHDTHWANCKFFQKSLTTLIKTYSQGNFRN